MTAGIFVALLIIEAACVWMVLDLSSVRKTLREIKRLMEERREGE